MSVSSVWIGITQRIFVFGIIMAKLDKNVITFFKTFVNAIPTFFGNETSGASTVGSSVIEFYFVSKELRKQLSPAAFRVFIWFYFIGHCRIANAIDSWF